VASKKPAYSIYIRISRFYWFF